MSDRQQRIHWCLSHLADALLLILLVGLVVHFYFGAW